MCKVQLVLLDLQVLLVIWVPVVHLVRQGVLDKGAAQGQMVNLVVQDSLVL